MKKIILTIALAAGLIASAQVKIGDNVDTINASSILELESTTKGVLFPRVALTSTTAFAPLAAHVAGMTVYNTATAGDVTPGMYTNDGTQWVKLAGGGGGTNLYNANGTLTGARTVTQDNNDLTFTTGTGKTIINGTFKTNGAVYGNIRTITTVPTATDYLDTDQFVIIKVSGVNNIALPNPASYANRILTIRNGSTQAGTTGTYTITTNVPLGSTSILTNKAQTYVSDGTNWYLFSY